MKLKKEAFLLKERDPILSRIIVENLPNLKSRGSVYESLISAIISQQISTSAATSIRNKFLKLFKNKFPVPKKLLAKEDKVLQKVGLSRQKVVYLKSVAKHFIDEKLDEAKFHKMTDQEVIDDLVKIKGVGEWTAEMVLIFSLLRKDIFSYKDFALLSPILSLYKIKKEKYSPKKLKLKVLKITNNWSPQRTLASRYLWHHYTKERNAKKKKN